MGESVLELSDRLWDGDIDTSTHHPLFSTGTLEEVAPGVAFVPSFANVSAFATDDGLVLVDTGSLPFARLVHQSVRSWDRAPLHTAVYSHGHIDHVFGVPVFEEEAATNGWAAPRVIAHEALPNRFDRYVLTAGYNEVVNQRQFGLPDLRWPVDYRYPDQTYADRHDIDVGGVRFELHHARGETDDHTWTWAPDLKVLCCGDLFIWASPNAGNPQKVQRYPREWALALREMADLGAELLLPGHGVPIAGAARIRTALTETAELLEHLHDETLSMMNAGARLDDIIHAVRAPAHLLARPYLRPVYDEPEFVIRNVWRLYGGWYDGNPAHLKPAPDNAFAAEVAALAGGAQRLAQRAAQLADAGDLRLAGHLAELAAQAAPDDASVHATRADVYQRRVQAESSTMAKGIFGWAARESHRQAGGS
ncbi:MAG: MBL fold metallo-hydrolase [Actinobacteria bacterium]|nr:MBL fold metallo-hydrolase [Actinomycetota bacterium]